MIERDKKELKRDIDYLDWTERRLDFYTDLRNAKMVDRMQWILDIYNDFEAAYIRLEETEQENEELRERIAELEQEVFGGRGVF